MSRLESFCRTCLHRFSRNKEISEKKRQPVRQRKLSGMLFGKPSKTPSSHQATVPKKSQDQQPSSNRPCLNQRRRPLSQFIYIQKQQPSEASTLFAHSKIQRPRSTLLDSPPQASLSSSCSSISSNTSSSSIRTPHSDLDQITALDFLLDEREYSLRNKKMHHRMSVPVRSCNGFIQHQHKHKQMLTGRKRLTSFETPALRPIFFGLVDQHQQKEEKAIQAWLQQLDQGSLENPVLDSTTRIDNKTELKWLALRKFIIHEIYSTEKSYHELLVLVRMRYMTPMLAASKEKDPLVKFNDIPILFNHLSALIDLSEKILAGFTMEKPHHHPAQHFASVASSLGYQWLQLHDDWKVFLRYAVHYEANNKTIKRACNNALLLKIEQESLTSRETKRMGMADYLIAPIQRVPRYCLLVKDLLRHTPTTDTDYHHLHKVVNTLTGLAKAMNDTQKLRRRKTISS
ncbi:Dbl homology domain-containing protein [Chlamydoabsidia padenii]|nr:Dbl homology domain-containing protein [Chlamydoabsidia padenii]